MSQTGVAPRTVVASQAAAAMEPAVDRRSRAWRQGAYAMAAAAVAAIVGALLRTHGIADAWTLVHWAAKPAATAVVLWLAWRHAAKIDARLHRGIVAGLVFSLLGDVLLMASPRLFVGGLLAFLVAHLCYLRAFTCDTRLLAQPAAFAGLLFVGAGILAVLWPGLDASLRIPVLAYMLVLVAMAAQAIARARLHPGLSTRYAAIGALLFVASDSLLAIDRFRAPIPLAALWVLGTYWAAQWGIAQSVRDPVRAHAPPRVATDPSG